MSLSARIGVDTEVHPYKPPTGGFIGDRANPPSSKFTMQRLLLIIILSFLIYRLFKNLFSSREDRRKSIPEDRSQIGSKEMVKDPQCNTYIPKDEAISRRIRGQSYYFCSKECAQRFKERKSAS